MKHARNCRPQYSSSLSGDAEGNDKVLNSLGMRTDWSYPIQPSLNHPVPRFLTQDETCFMEDDQRITITVSIRISICSHPRSSHTNVFVMAPMTCCPDVQSNC